MRIVGGTLRGRPLLPPLSRATRPMMDRIREALFNILLHHDWERQTGPLLEGANVLDAFCGTGALAFEALSRGGARATLFDKDRQALEIANKNAEALGVKDRAIILPADALQPPRANRACNLVFLAPPYRKGLIAPALSALEKAGWISPDAVIVAETAKKEELELPSDYEVLFDRSYSDTTLHFLRS